MNIKINVSKPYNVYIEHSILKNAGEIALKYVPLCNALIITDDIVDGLHSKDLETSLLSAGYNVNKFVFKNGEKSKNISTLTDILNFMAELKMTRKDVVFALGGGVCGDLAGFAAATYLRGIKFVQVPTTFLAAVDSSVGGKTGINLDSGKNLAGAFHQPSAVICDCDTFKTLPEKVFADGVAEAIKSGIIADSKLFEAFEDGTYRQKLDYITSSCVKIKGYVVENDEFESNMRKLLNLGHTVGHAVEKCSNYQISHGEAVAIGMAIVSKAAEKSNLAEKGTSDRIIDVLKKYNLPIVCSYSPDELSEVILNDKKRAGDYVTFVIPQSIGKCILKDIATSDICRFISLGMEA